MKYQISYTVGNISKIWLQLANYNSQLGRLQSIIIKFVVYLPLLLLWPLTATDQGSEIPKLSGISFYAFETHTLNHLVEVLLSEISDGFVDL